jgi:hypothetical protein
MRPLDTAKSLIIPEKVLPVTVIIVTLSLTNKLTSNSKLPKLDSSSFHNDKVGEVLISLFLQKDTSPKEKETQFAAKERALLKL